MKTLKYNDLAMSFFFFWLAGQGCYKNNFVNIFYVAHTPIALTKPTFVFARALYVVINKCRLNHLLCMLMCEKLISLCPDVNPFYIYCVLASC